MPDQREQKLGICKACTHLGTARMVFKCHGCGQWYCRMCEDVHQCVERAAEVAS